MRTTLSIDDDVLRAVQERARREHSTVGKILSDLARQALAAVPAQSDNPPTRFGFQPLPPRGGVVSNELIDRLRDDEGV